jgi:hypothetical protein
MSLDKLKAKVSSIGAEYPDRERALGAFLWVVPRLVV